MFVIGLVAIGCEKMSDGAMAICNRGIVELVIAY